MLKIGNSLSVGSLVETNDKLQTMEKKRKMMVFGKNCIHLLSTNLIKFVFSKIKMHFSYLDSAYGIEWKIKKSS